MIRIAIVASIVFGGLFALPSEVLGPTEERETRPASVLFVGDMMFDRHIRRMMERTDILSCAKEKLRSFDVVVGNLEGPVTEHPSVSLGSVVGSPENFVFTFSTSTVGVLHAHNIRLVNLGNNHILNFGYEGMRETKRWLDLLGVSYFGGVLGDEPVYRVRIEDEHLSFVSYNQFGGMEPAEVVKVIAEERAFGRTVIVYAHWGEEYVAEGEREIAAAHLFVDVGASAVIGSHPHVVQGSEVYKGAPIYYSLGNFVFDQYWEERVRSGLAVGLEFLDGRVSVQEYPVELTPDGRTCFIEGKREI